MLQNKTLTDYAKLILKMGVNLQKGQGLEISCPVEKHQIAEVLTEQAYKAGAKMVRVRWTDERIDRLGYDYAKTEDLTSIPKWLVDSRNFLVENDYCYVAVSADDPSAFKGVDSNKIATVCQARSKALKKYSDAVMSNTIRWCVVSLPTKAWAEQVFPNSINAEEELSNAIEKAMRLNYDDPLKAWEEHVKTLERRANFLNEKNFEYICFKNSIGTNLRVGLAQDHQWITAKEKAKDGLPFIANIPTEEIFTAPHRLKVDGVLHSALPLAENGQIVDDFTITFSKGKIISYTAKVGYDTLKGLIETDNGTYRLGEIALIGKSSPIAKSGILFYNTLFDENASCHLAIGKGYPSTIKDGDKLSISQLKKKGLNDSIEHIDFMIGTPDLTVTGIGYDKKETILFSDGDWVI